MPSESYSRTEPAAKVLPDPTILLLDRIYKIDRTEQNFYLEKPLKTCDYSDIVPIRGEGVQSKFLL